MNYQDINAQTIDQWIEDGWEWGQPVSHEAYLAALKGRAPIFLTPTKPVPGAWLGDVKGKRILGLASGGGQQMPLLTAMGARCTVLDYSPRQLESERIVAAREGYSIEIVRADMTKPLPFEDEAFDLIVHPVSNCYVESVEPIFRECHRVLKKGGALLSGLLVTELVYYYVSLSFVLPVFVGVMFTLLHAAIQTYVLTTLVSIFYGEAVEPKPKKIKEKKA